MSLRQKERLTTVVMVIGALLGSAGAYITDTWVLTVTGIVILFVGFLLHLCWYHCPHCGAFLGRNSIPNFCPDCGKAIDPDRRD